MVDCFRYMLVYDWWFVLGIACLMCFGVICVVFISVVGDVSVGCCILIVLVVLTVFCLFKLLYGMFNYGLGLFSC